MRLVFNRRMWLNGNRSASTGSVVGYAGPAPWDTGSQPNESIFLEVADCHGKVRLHKSDADSKRMFVNKLRRLAAFITAFADALEREINRNRKG